MELSVKQNREMALTVSNKSFGNKIGLLAALFGCWHRNLSRPFTQGRVSYRVCLDCGARKPFDAQTLTTCNAFYFPP